MTTHDLDFMTYLALQDAIYCGRAFCWLAMPYNYILCGCDLGSGS